MRMFITCAATDAVKKGGQKSGSEQRPGNSSGIVIVPPGVCRAVVGLCTRRRSVHSGL